MLRASPRTPELSEISDKEFNRAYFKELKANRHDDWGSSDASDAASSDHSKKKSHKKAPQRESESEASSDKQVKKVPKPKEDRKKKQ
jgi:hypothetical protein